MVLVKNGDIFFPGGISYKLLVIPGKRKMAPEGTSMSPIVMHKMSELVKEGGQVIFVELPEKSTGLQDYPEKQ